MSMQGFTSSRLVYAIGVSGFHRLIVCTDGEFIFLYWYRCFLTKVLTVYIKIHPGAVFLRFVNAIINQFYTTLVPSLVFLLDSGNFEWRTVDKFYSVSKIWVCVRWIFIVSKEYWCFKTTFPPLDDSLKRFVSLDFEFTV